MNAHEYTCHVRFSDVDVYGHVNNVKYFEYFQEARLVFLRGLREGVGEHGFDIVLAQMDVDYKRPILFRPEPYVVRTRVTRVGTSSFGLDSEILDGEQLLSRARAVLVTFDLARNRSRPLSDRERTQLRELQD